MSKILEISSVGEIRTAKNGRPCRVISFEPAIDKDGVLDIPADKWLFGDVCHLVEVGMKVRI